MELAQAKTPGRQVIESYGAGRFRVSGTVHEGSVIVFPDRTEPWRIAAFDQIDQGSFAGITAADVDLLLLGCGPRMCLVPRSIRQPLRTGGVVLEPMATGAACRTFNVLMAEGRRVAAALIAVE
ncbi:uncharacterized protein ABIE65_000164 [Constrictibacter sp. MBR-5]|jgi:uncharacterized protein|uniref:Mth938-like domain-containing protein n=1 Tax=Constrictibacter sp. MBR-5 TaxID=3156467 RepID=UPI00339364D4